MIDFISATLHIKGKDTPNLGQCKFAAKYESGWIKYWLIRCERIEVWWNPELKMLRICGSLAYFWKGHNFTCTNGEFAEAICYINTLLQVDMWRSEINAFEYAVIMKVDESPKGYIRNHISDKSLKLTEKEKDRGQLRKWDDKNVSLKMYDAGRNIKMKQGLQRREVLEEAGWNPEEEYLKWEAHYLKPEYLNNGRAMILANLMNPNWEDIFKEDLYIQYKRLTPMKTIQLPNNKKDLTTPDFLLLALAEVEINKGTTLQGLKKMLYDRLNSIPEEILTKADKDGRKRQIKAAIDKLEESPESKWDLSAKLEEALK